MDIRVSSLGYYFVLFVVQRWNGGFVYILSCNLKWEETILDAVLVHSQGRLRRIAMKTLGMDSKFMEGTEMNFINHSKKEYFFM